MHELRRFLGMLNYYRKCIPRAAHIQAPLNDYLTKSIKNDKTPINWNPDTLKAFEDCKQSIVNTTMNTFPSPSAPLILTTDASDTAVGAVLEQLEGDIRRPLGFFSKKLSPTEQSYSTYDRELLAVYQGIKYFKPNLEARKFIICTDHKPLIYAFHQKSDKASPRQIRQLDFISQFTTDIIHVKGSDNTVADALSRINAISMPSLLTSESIFEEQQKDEELQHILNSANSAKLQKLTLPDNIIIYCDTTTGIVRPYIPSALRRIAFDTVHRLAHPSGKVTCRQLREKYIWPSIRRDALKWSRECIPCQRAKIQRHNKVIPSHIDVPDSRFNHLHLDIIHMPPVRGFKYCLTIIDRFSRFPKAIPLKDITAPTIAAALFNKWICMFGTPLSITTDQGSQFESSLFQALSNLISTKRIRTTPHHPSSNGMVERWHRTLKAALMCNAEIPWPDMLPATLLGLRTTYKEDLQASPAEMLFGTTLRVPGEFFVQNELPADPETFIIHHREIMNAIRPVPTSHHVKPKIFFQKNLADCSHVFIRVDHVRPPLTPPYTGPHQVITRLDDRRYVILVDGSEKTISVERLKPAHED